MTRRRSLRAFILVFGVCTLAVSVGAQTDQQKDVLIGAQLQPGFDMGVNSSGSRTDWVSTDGASLKMAYPANQAWGAVFVTFGPVVNPPRPGINLSTYSTLVVEIRGDPGKTIELGIKDKNQPDDGTETKVKVLLTTNWRTYTIPLSRFTRANLAQVYVVTEFVYADSAPITAWVRGIHYTTKAAASIDNVVNAGSFQPGVGTGSWVTIFGNSLSPTTRPWGNADFQSNKLPKALDGVSVNLNEQDMAVAYVSPKQVNSLVFSNVPAGPIFVTVTNGLGTSVPIMTTVQALFPALFTIDPNQKYVAAIHLDGILVSKTLCAIEGSSSMLLGTS